MSEGQTKPLAYYEAAGEIELGRGDVISSIDIAAFPGDYPVYSSSAVGAGEFGRYGRFMFDEELITWSIDGGGRPFYRPKHRYSVTNVCGYMRIRKPDLWSYRYLHALLEKLQSGIQFDYQMKAHPSVIRELYRFSRIPLIEQQKIGEILDTTDTAIRETEAIIAKLKAVKQGLLHDLLTRGIDANGELRPPQSEAPHLYKQSPLGWIPKEWDCAPLVSRIDFPQGQVDPRKLPYKGWILIAPDHVEPVTGRLIARVTALEQGAISGKYVFGEGDVVYSKIRPYLRKAVLATETGLCSADMYPLRPSNGVLPRFLLAVILGEKFSRFAESVSQRSGFPKINREEMAEFSFAWPPIEEQARIVKPVLAFDQRQSLLDDELAGLLKLKVGLMDDLLTGRVRVTPLLSAEEQVQARSA